jgi:cytochrome c oxidase subunit II
MSPVFSIAFLQQSHSVLSPHSPESRLIDRLWDAMYLVSVVMFVLVTGALLWAVLHRRPPSGPTTNLERERRLTVGVVAATVLTGIVLFGFLISDVLVGRTLSGTGGKEALQIRVTGHQWWWEIQYRDSVPNNWATTANELHVPTGRSIVLELRSTDVIHSFWPPSLSPKRDLIPGNVNTLRFHADSPGVYRGQCAEYCGHQHAKMGFLVIAEPPDSFARWLARQRDTAQTPTTELARQGQEVFLSSSCVMCHSIAGTRAGSRIGPDLTHLASRRTIAAGTLPNTRGNLAGWIVDPQRIKPGAKMPPTQLDPGDLQALLAYLESLK